MGADLAPSHWEWTYRSKDSAYHDSLSISLHKALRVLLSHFPGSRASFLHCFHSVFSFQHGYFVKKDFLLQILFLFIFQIHHLGKQMCSGMKFQESIHISLSLSSSPLLSLFLYPPPFSSSSHISLSPYPSLCTFSLDMYFTKRNRGYRMPRGKKGCILIRDIFSILRLKWH